MNLNNHRLSANNTRQEFSDYTQSGKNLFYKTDYKQAQSFLEKAMVINPANPDACLFMSYVLASLCRPAAALGYADKTFALEPAYQAANLARAQIYLSQQELEKATDELYYILEHREYWFAYTPLYAEQMLKEITAALGQKNQ